MSGDDILIKDPWGESDISAFIIFLSVRNPLKRVIDTLLKKGVSIAKEKSRLILLKVVLF